MKTYLDCMPCLVRQALDTARLVKPGDDKFQEHSVREALRDLLDMDASQPPPAASRRIHARVRELSGVDDPYLQEKQRFNALALRLLPRLRDRIIASDRPLEMALRLSIAGNIIDVGIHHDISDDRILRTLEHDLETPLDADIEEFASAVQSTSNLLYLADNAGEIVLDRLLIEQIIAIAPGIAVTVVVRGAPVLNDAVYADAVVAGLTEWLEVIDNGSDAPGTLLDLCSESFRTRFFAADLIIAKGQGNFETLASSEQDIYFALKAKCSVVARLLGCVQGSAVLRRSSRHFKNKSGEDASVAEASPHIASTIELPTPTLNQRHIHHS